MQKQTSKPAIQKMVLTALLSAMAIGLFYLEFPLFPAASYLKLDFSDFPALVAGIFIGPVAGVVVELLKNLVELLTKGLGTTMGFGNLMNFAVGVAYVLPASLLFRGFKQRKALGAALGCIAGLLAIVAVGLGMNYIVAPLFYRYFVQREITHAEIIASLGYATLINLIKGAMLSVGAILLLNWQKRAPGLWRTGR
ncbi:MAG: ECF transporter S component [Oscillospiraceae bacterium]|jgi:riboflavin transporter FmnP|nr:ECF transporter S component [Oscillospiraceae bacterium]